MIPAPPPPAAIAPPPPPAVVEYWGWDVETYPNLFSVVAINITTDECRVFEMSDRRNDGIALYEFIYSLSGRAVMVGFNNLGFDYPVLHHCMMAGNFLAMTAYAKAQQIISSQDERFGETIWPSDRIVPQLDLYKIHHFDNRAKSTSLKALEFAMRSESIEDLPYAVGSYLTPEQIDVTLAYNKHDVEETIRFFHHSRAMVDFRAELTAKYGQDFTNHNDTKIGKEYFIMELEKAGVPCFDRSSGRKQPRQTFRTDGIPLRDIIFPYIRFEHPEFNRVLDYLRGIVIHDTKADPQLKDLSAIVREFQFDYGTGGIHGSVHNRIIRSTDTHVILDVDVASMYPNIAIANRVYPQHLSARFCDIYGLLYEQRRGYAKGTAENAMLKLALNGVYGDSNNVYSPFYDPQYTMAITINGQLVLSMLAEAAMADPDLTMIQANTDGISVYLPRANVERFRAACRAWEVVTGLQLEEAEYATMAVRDVNNYVAVSASGKVKRLGAYDYEKDWHQDASALVVAKAVEAAITTGCSVDDAIAWHFDPFDFAMRAKVPRSSRLEATDGAVLQNTTRYHIARHGPSLVKIMPPLPKKPDAERRIGISVGWPVNVCNRMADFDWDNLDRAYYAAEAHKLLDPLRCD